MAFQKSTLAIEFITENDSSLRASVHLARTFAGISCPLFYSMNPRIDGLVLLWKSYLPENRGRMLGWLDEKEAGELLKALKVKDLSGLMTEIKKRYD